MNITLLICAIWLLGIIPIGMALKFFGVSGHTNPFEEQDPYIFICLILWPIAFVVPIYYFLVNLTPRLSDIRANREANRIRKEKETIELSKQIDDLLNKKFLEMEAEGK